MPRREKNASVNAKRMSRRISAPASAQTVLYSLPIILLMLIVYLTMFGSSFALLVAGADESAVAQAMLRGTGSGLFTAVLLLLVVSGPLTFGLMRFYTDLTRGGRPGAAQSFSRSPRAHLSGQASACRSACSCAV